MTPAGRAIRPWRSAVAILLVVCAVGAAAVGGCAGQKPKIVDFSEGPRGYRERDYGDVYERWTRHGQALYQVDVALEVWATFKSWDFREAYIERYASVYVLSDADKAALRTGQLDALHHAYEFHVTAQSTNYKWNDLEKPSSPWRVALVDALGHELQPEYVRVERLPDAYETAFFPSKTAFTKTYSIRFAISAGADSGFSVGKAGSVTLRFSSPLARLELGWQGG